MKPLDLPAVVAFLKANSEAQNDPNDPHQQAIAHIDRLANALVFYADGDGWQALQARTGYSEAQCREMVAVNSDALAYLIAK